MDAGQLTLFGFPIEKDKKRDHFSYWHCALIKMAKPDFYKKNKKRILTNRWIRHKTLAKQDSDLEFC